MLDFIVGLIGVVIVLALYAALLFSTGYFVGLGLLEAGL
jgi:hypothetical protein